MLLQRSLEHDSRVQREAAALRAAGYQVAILEIAPTGDLPEFDRREVRAWRGAAERARSLRVHQAVVTLAYVAAILRLRPRIVHAHDVATLLPGLVGARLVGAALVYDSHELASGVAYRHGLFARIVTAIERVAIRRAARVITVSDSIADRLLTMYGLTRRPVVVRNFCALARLGETDPPGGLRQYVGLDDEPLILHQGAAAPQRGCDALVRAMANVPGAHLVFLGTAEPGFDEELRALTRSVGVAERVHFVAGVPLDGLLRYTREADVGVTLFESTCENYRLTIPNKLFEYVAAGLPVVGSAQREVERLIRDHGIGWIVDPSDVGALAAALRRSLGQTDAPELRARLRAADHAFSWPEESRRLTDAYRTLEA